VDGRAAGVERRRIGRQHEPAHRSADGLVRHGPSQLGDGPLGDDGVGVEEEEDLARRTLGTEVAASREPEIAPRPDHFHVLASLRLVDLTAVVPVVDDHDLLDLLLPFE
jgi:hypothetical protein